jgi:hypothetical protein
MNKWVKYKTGTQGTKAEGAWSAREKNMDFPLKVLFTFRGKSSFS